jgi:hypothetical protein
MMKYRQSNIFMARLLLTATVALGCSSVWAQAPEPKPEPLSAFPQSLLAIKTGSGKVVNFKIWLADSQRREEQGLMFIHALDAHAGMLFMFPGDKPVTMWMRNTYIPLDLLFLDAHGKIDYIAADAAPMSDTIIGPPTLEFAVLELKGGACETFGVKVGDVVLHKNFKNAR